MFCGFALIKTAMKTNLSFTDTVVTAGTDGRPVITEALIASLFGDLGDQRHLVEAACKHEGSHSKIKWKRLCIDVLYLISNGFCLVYEKYIYWIEAE